MTAPPLLNQEKSGEGGEQTAAFPTHCMGNAQAGGVRSAVLRERVRKRMNIYKNVKLTPRDREEMVRRLDSMPSAAVASGFSITLRTAQKWKSRYRQGGVEALVDKSSRPLRCRSKLTEKTNEEIFFLRRRRLTEDEIAAGWDLIGALSFAPCVNLAAHVLLLWRPSLQCGVISGKSPDKCCIWISSVWAGLTVWYTEMRKLGKFTAVVPAGNICMSALMTLRGWPVRLPTRTRRRNRLWNYPGVLLPGIRRRA